MSKRGLILGPLAVLSLVVGLCVPTPGLHADARQPEQPQDSLTPDWRHSADRGFTLYATAADQPLAAAMRDEIRRCRDRIAGFFDTTWTADFEVFIFPDRQSLDHQWQQDWQAPEFRSACWMVASGVSTRLDFLSTRVWPAEACEHNAADSLEWRLILAHELTHVFHGQQNPVPDFAGLDDIGWFVEGLAVLASGQLDNDRQAQAVEAREKGVIPKQLNELWSGKYRYAVCGSLVDFIDRTYGRAIIRRLLVCTTESQILAVLQTSSGALLEGWQNSLRR